MTAPVVIQSGAQIGAGNSPASCPTLGSAVTAGNLLVAVVFCDTNQMSVTFPVTGQNGWTLQGSAAGAGANGLNIAYYTRTAMSGDGTTPPSPTGGSNYSNYCNGLSLYEVSGSGGLDVVLTNTIGTTSPQIYPAAQPLFEDDLAICCSQWYNNNAGAGLLIDGLPGTWSTDSYANNSSPSFGVMNNSQALGAGTTAASVMGTINSGHGTQYCVLLLKATSPPAPPTVYVIQTAYGDGHSSSPQPVLPAAPTTGNLVIGFCTSDVSPPNPGINGWTYVDTNVVSESVGLYYRYVQSGDTATYGPMVTGGTYMAAMIWEVEGASGTWADALVLEHIDPWVSGASTTVTGQTTTGPDQLALIGGLQNTTFGPQPSLSSPWIQNILSPSGTFETDGIGGGQFYSSGGSSVSATVDWNTTPSKGAVLTIILTAGGPATETGNVTMSFGGIVMVVDESKTVSPGVTLNLDGVAMSVGGDAAKGGNVTLTLEGIAMAVDAFKSQEVGNVTLALDGIAVSVVAYDVSALPEVTQFWTFG